LKLQGNEKKYYGILITLDERI